MNFDKCNRHFHETNLHNEKTKNKFFLNNDILNSKRININVNKQIIIIENCKNIKIQFNVINVKFSIKRVIRVNEIIKISIK